MAQHYSPRIVQDGLVMCLDASQNKSYPTDLPVKDGLVMWMDAADDTTFSYSSGTTVSQWRDKSGFNYHMTPLAGSPTRNAFQNSRKVVAFTTAQDIQNTSIDLRTSPYTVFIVSRYTSPSAGTGRILTSNGGYNNWLLGHWASETNKYYANGWVYQTYAAIDTNWKLYLGDWGGSSNNIAAFYTAGTSLITNSANVGAGPWTLGINANSGERSNCEAAEIIVFNRLLSTVERRLVHTYLGQKWGISNTDRSIIDLSGNDDNGLLGNGTTANMPVFDYYNKGGLKFDGANDFIQYPSLLNLGNSFTINFWIKPTSNTRQTIVSNGYPYLANKGFFLVCPGNNATDMFLSLGNDQKSVQSNTGAITTGVIQMVTAVVNGLTNLMRLYVNGVEVSYAVQNDANVSLQYDSGIFVTGKRDTTSADYLSSHLYALQIYSRGLSAAEVFQNYNSQKSKFDNTIVQQGLVLNLDANNPYSYAGAGTTWYDVSVTGNNSTLSNGPTYNTDVGGNIVFDGVDDYVDVTIPNLTTTVTLDFWVKYTNLTSNMIFGFLLYDIYGYSGALGFNTANSDVYGLNSTQVTNLGIIGNWKHIVFVMRSDVSYTNNKIYVNGVVQTLSQVLGSESGKSFNSGNARISGWRNDSGYKLPGSIGSFKAYNRELSAAEVLQNYNATKGRFGL